MDDLWQQALHHLDKGNFSRLETVLGGPEKFDAQIIDWFDAGKFADEPEALAEAFTCSCMLGRMRVAEYLLVKDVDPVAGMKTGLNGFHYAVSGGHLDVVKLLIDRHVPVEVENMYGGTVFSQSLWSAANEYKPSHADIIEALLEAKPYVDPDSLRWWNEQDIPSAEAKTRVADLLRRHTENA
jgi:ankyrin repeat protein